MAAFQAPIITMNQNREATKGWIAKGPDYEANLHTTAEIPRLHRKIDRMFNTLGQLHGDLRDVSESTEGMAAAAAASWFRG